MGLARILPITQSAMALTALAWLTLQGSITLWQIYLLTTLQAVAMAFDAPARQAMVPNLVPAKDLSNAFILTSIAGQTGAIIGPAMSGLVIAYAEQLAVYAINAVTYLAVILALILMGAVQQEKDPTRRTTVSMQSIKEGIQFILNQPIILSTMLLDFFATYFSSANTLLPIFACDVLGVGVVAYGWLSAAQFIGAVGAALVASQLREIRHQGRTFLGAVVVFGLATIVFGLSRSLILSMLALMVIGTSDSVSMIIRNTIRQLQTPDYIRWRMTSVNQIFFMGETAIRGVGSRRGGTAAGGALRGRYRGCDLHPGGDWDR